VFFRVFGESGESVAQGRNSSRADREARERLRLYNARREVFERQVSRRRRDNVLAVVGVLVVAILAGLTQVAYFTAGPGAPAPSPSSSATPSATPTEAAGANVGEVPDPSVAEGRTWTGELALNKVHLGIELDGAAAPQAVAVFVQAVEDGYYEGKTCHRIVEDTLIQCGSAAGDGVGQTDFQFGPIENAPADGTYPTGTIAMARGDSEYSMDHQFFITFADVPLPSDAGYTVIGTVTSGLDDLLDSPIVTAGTDVEDGDGAPVTSTVIQRVSIE
jgi:peptidyl-prolyl cis-trans isomerase B (cyclophilin B)